MYKMVKKGLTIFVTCLAIVTGIIWYKVYLPLSPKIGDSGSKILPFFAKLLDTISYTGDKLGIGSEIKICQALVSFLDWTDFGLWEKGIHVQDTIIAGVPVTIFRPDTHVATPPALIHFHGGGLAFGKLKAYMRQCILFANGTKSVVISVDYRVAPENIFPAQFNDGFAVVSAVMNEPTKFGIDGNRVALGGDSAGGLLSAAISLEFAKQSRPSKIAAQVLMYPWLQLIDVVCLPSYKAYSQGFLISDRSIALFASLATMGNSDMIQEYLVGNISRYFMETPYWKYLKIPENSNCKILNQKSVVELPSNFVNKVTDPRLSPLLAEKLEGSPPTFVAIAEYDVLASEGKLFAERLQVAGVPVIKKQYKTYHGEFLLNTGMPIGNTYTLAKVSMNDMINFLNSVFYENVS